MKNNDQKLITILCAIHNEEKTIPLFYERLTKVIEKINYNFEILFTNNCSTDKSLEIIKALAQKDERVTVLTFSRNFGYQCSIQAGMEYANGDAIITIDVDCEDPPELIPTFIENWEKGNEIVYGIRQKRPEPQILISTRNLFYRILKMTADTEIILNMAEFGLVSSTVRNHIINNSNTFPFLRTEIAYSGFQRVGIPYNREKRIAGETHYNLWRMTLFAVGGILSSSTFPLRFAVYFFPVLSILNLLLFLLSLFNFPYILNFLFIFDFCYISLLITFQGIYIARIYKNGLGRPLYIVDWKNSLMSPKKGE